jgi:hypothetical protein
MSLRSYTAKLADHRLESLNYLHQLQDKLLVPSVTKRFQLSDIRGLESTLERKEWLAQKKALEQKSGFALGNSCFLGTADYIWDESKLGIQAIVSEAQLKAFEGLRRISDEDSEDIWAIRIGEHFLLSNRYPQTRWISKEMLNSLLFTTRSNMLASRLSILELDSLMQDGLPGTWSKLSQLISPWETTPSNPRE